MPIVLKIWSIVVESVGLAALPLIKYYCANDPAGNTQRGKV